MINFQDLKKKEVRVIVLEILKEERNNKKHIVRSSSKQELNIKPY